MSKDLGDRLANALYAFALPHMLRQAGSLLRQVPSRLRTFAFTRMIARSSARLQTASPLESSHDGLTWLHRVTIDLSDDTDAGFYATGSDYEILLYPDTETVDGENVGSVLAHWSIENRAAPSLRRMFVEDSGDTYGDAVAGSVVKEIADNIPTIGGAAPPTNWASMGIESNGHVHADVKEWLGAAVNALVSGRVDASTGNMAANVLNAAAIATDAITAAKIAANAIGASELATDAIGADEISAAAVAKIAAAILSDATPFAGANVDAAISTRATPADVDSSLTSYDAATAAELTATETLILDRLLAYFQLALRADSAIFTDRAAEFALINADEGSGAGTYSDNDTNEFHSSRLTTISSNLSTLGNAMGWGQVTGTGTDQLFGWLQALMRSDAGTPASLGGTTAQQPTLTKR